MWKQHKRILFSVIEGKGGVGKSFIAQLLSSVAMGPEGLGNVRMIDSDVNNSSLAQIYEHTEFAGIRGSNDLKAIGTISMALKELGDDVIDAVVWDTAAGTEDIITARVLPSLAARAKKAKVNIVVARPITTSRYTQESALEFAAWARTQGIATLFVRNLGQARAARYFADWDANTDRNAFNPPIAEVILPDLGAWLSDEATALGLSIEDVALGRFDKLPERGLQIANDKFPPTVQLAVADWIELRRTEFEEAIDFAIATLSATPTTKSKARVE